MDSVLSQTYRNWECLVIDDDSIDNTSQIVQEYIDRDSRISFYKRTENLPKGANSCRNYGFRLSRGEFIKFFDSDDIMLKDHLEILFLALKQHKVDFVIGDTVNFTHGFEELGEKHYNFDRAEKEITANAFAKQQIGWLTVDFFGKRSGLEAVEFNEHINYGDEYNFFTRYLLQDVKGKWVNKILTHRRLHPETLTEQASSTEREFLSKVCDLKFQTFLDICMSRDRKLKKWFLKGYMLNSFNLARSKQKPPHIGKSVKPIFSYYPIGKALAFYISVFLAFRFNKGYYFLKYSRK